MKIIEFVNVYKKVEKAQLEQSVSVAQSIGVALSDADALKVNANILLS